MEEEQQEMISHFSHQHPFAPIPESRMGRGISSWCGFCHRYFAPGDVVYGCNNDCEYEYCSHRECLEMPREIRHPLHPPHPLKQLENMYHGLWKCRVCQEYGYGACYICSESCESFIHLRCAVGVDVGVGGEEVTMKHPSHALHELKYLRRPCSFQCDACGTTEKGSSYGCSICQYWIHERCARLPQTASFPHHHHHPLSLAFCLPLEYILYDYTCDVCKGGLSLKQWVYHCQLCRYVVHIKCATNTSLATLNNEDAIDDSKDIIKFPIDEADEELIKPFVAREIKERGIEVPHGDNKININGKYHFHNHPHPLKLITLSPSSHYNKEDGDDEEEDILSGILQLLCDGCTMPIREHKQRSSPDYYLSCGECKYFLHLVCFNLPLELPCLQLHSDIDHKLALRSSDKLTNWTKCYMCGCFTNGLYYGCTKCNFKVDIICASLPLIIKHAAHPQRNHYLKLRMGVPGRCGVCSTRYSTTVSTKFYRCDSCKFKVCWNCIMLPATNKHRSEKHLLPLTYDANLNHPSEFYCGDCEIQMDPKGWMYHCRDCDQSFHTSCFPATTGKYRNINCGIQQYTIAPCHPLHHTLRFQLISKKKYCDTCHSKTYDDLGFQCVSCNFAMCFFGCGIKYMGTIKAIN